MRFDTGRTWEPDGWRDADGGKAVVPARWYHPETRADLEQIVAEALDRGVSVRAMGSRHSFSDVGRPEARGYLVDTDALKRPLELPKLRAGVDAAALVQVEAGLKLYALNALLEGRGRALANLGGYTGQSIAGVISTATHGSGLTLGSLDASVRSLVVVTEKGTLRIEPSAGISDPRASEPGVRLVQNDDLFECARVSMGCFGIIAAVVLETVPRFWLVERRKRVSWAEVKASSDALHAKHRHVEIWLNPHPEPSGEIRCLVTTRDLLDAAPPYPTPDDALAQNRTLAHVMTQVLGRHPHFSPWMLNQVINRYAGQTNQNLGHKILADDLTVRGYATESAVAFGEHFRAVESVIRVAADQVRERDRYMSLVSMRFVKASKAPMSPMFGRDTCMLEIPTPSGLRESDAVLRAASGELREKHDGRPHWGLNLEQFGESVTAMYPRFAEWKQQYRALNPRRTFRNEFTDRLGLDPVLLA